MVTPTSQLTGITATKGDTTPRTLVEGTRQPASVAAANQAHPPQFGAVVEDLTLYERARTAQREQGDARLAYQGAKVTYDREEYVARTAHIEARRDFVASMTNVYRDPNDAVRRFEADAAVRSAAQAIDTLYMTPEAYGPLRTTAERRMLGIALRSTDQPARQEAHRAAVLAVRVEQRRLEALELPRATRALYHARERLDTAAARVHALPSPARLERSIREALAELQPREIRQLNASLTQFQRTVVTSITRTVRDVAIGRDGPER